VDKPVFTRTMSLEQAIKAHPGASRVLVEYGVFCFGCEAAKESSLEHCAETQGVDTDELIEALNNLTLP